ncbi:protein kinase [Dactylosporangium sp. CA-139114]|uniref:protein kinase n=1 Tax=Dactylosporangium sp. CA-139114 TaxID=3239931 RepID=UPI003D9A0734
MELLHRYRLDRVIAVGSTAEIWRGYDRLLQRPVAVRLLRTDRPGRREAFLAAGRATARLTHPNIVAVYDVGIATLAERGRTPFVVMELADGHSLATRLEAGRPTWPAAVRIGAGVAAAVADAHRQWVGHGRLGPAKMLLTDVGVKVVGFGGDLSDDFDAAQRDVRALCATLATCLDDDGVQLAPSWLQLLLRPAVRDLPGADELARRLAAVAESTVEIAPVTALQSAVPNPTAPVRRRGRWTLRTVVALPAAGLLLLGGVAALGQAAPGGLPWFGHPPEIAVAPPDGNPCAGVALDPRACAPAEAPSRPAPTTARHPTPMRSKTTKPSGGSTAPTTSATPSRSPAAPSSAAPSGSPSASPSSPTASPSRSPVVQSPTPTSSRSVSASPSAVPSAAVAASGSPGAA